MLKHSLPCLPLKTCNNINFCPLWLSKISPYVFYESTQTFACLFAVPHKLLMSPRLHICSVFIAFYCHNYPLLPKLHITPSVILHSLWSIRELTSSDLIYLNPSNSVPSLINKKKREKQGEQTKPVSVTKIPAIEKNGIPVDCLHCPTPASLCINTSSTLWESQLLLVDLSLS